jgi:hypothetical protein
MNISLPHESYQDMKAVAAMAKARDATKPGPDGSPPLVKILEFPDDNFASEDLATSLMPRIHSPPSSYSLFLAEIRRHLSKNQPVLVRGWKRPNSCRFTREGIKSLRGSLEQEVKWQGDMVVSIL